MSKMTELVHRFRCNVQIFKSLLHVLLFHISSEKPIIQKDISRWILLGSYKSPNYTSTYRQLAFLLWSYPEYRNLFYYRIGKDRSLLILCLREVAKWLYKPMETLYIYSEAIGPGLFIQHGFSTIIVARKIGENCWINQQVTIGFKHDGQLNPILGNNVEVTAGAKVLGNIIVQDNVRIGANAVVIKDVPANCTVVGVPAYIVKRDNKKTHEPL